MNNSGIAVITKQKYEKDIQDSIRELRTNLISSEYDYSTFLVTSTNRGEGRTTISFNLALSLSRCGKKTVWINCDFRGKSNVLSFRYKEGKKENEQGLCDYLNENCSLDDIIYKVDEEELQVIPCGDTKEMSCDLFERKIFTDMLTQLEQDYEYIILDTSAAKMCADSKILAPKCGGIIYVIQYNKSNRFQINKVIRELKKCKGNIIGAVLNQSRPY